jgi:hypothetical protein
MFLLINFAGIDGQNDLMTAQMNLGNSPSSAIPGVTMFPVHFCLSLLA